MTMTPEIWIGLAGLVLTLLAIAVTYGMTKQKVADMDDKLQAARVEFKTAIESERKITDIAMGQMREDVGDAKTLAREAAVAAAKVEALAQSVDNLAANVTRSMEHIGQLIAAKMETVHQRIDGLAAEVKHASGRAPRNRSKAP